MAALPEPRSTWRTTLIRSIGATMVFEMAPAPWRDRDSEERLVVKSGESSGLRDREGGRMCEGCGGEAKGGKGGQRQQEGE